MKKDNRSMGRLPEKNLGKRERREDWQDKFLKEGKGMVMCKKCHDAREHKEWHAGTVAGVPAGVHLALCPACTMIERGQYEGEILVSGVTPEKEGEFLNFLLAYGKRARTANSQHRLIEIAKKGKGGYRITTTENQLAPKLGKKIAETFKPATHKVSFAEEPYKIAVVKVTLGA